MRDAAQRPRLGLWAADVVQARRLWDGGVVAVARLPNQRLSAASDATDCELAKR
jgi:hypothetical protein